jgi:phospholipase/carboxylesterase
MSGDPSFIHIFNPGKDDHPPILLLHGTGGDETSLLPLASAVAPGFPVISPRGKVIEAGQPRYFRRFAEGVLDEDDLRFRASELAEFVACMRKRHSLLPPIALGFSNGANIAIAMLLLAPDALAAAVLLRPMLPFRHMPEAKLDGRPVLVLSGREDRLAAPYDLRRLVDHLKTAGAKVTHQILPGGHHISPADEVAATDWLATIRLPGGI